jgi:hypothetical protein
VSELWPLAGLSFILQMMNMESHGRIILTEENGRTRRKSYASATLSTTWTKPGANSGLRGDRPATYRLNDGTAASQDSLAIQPRVQTTIFLASV